MIGESRWSGHITMEESFTGDIGTSKRKVSVSFVDALPTLWRDDETTDLDNFTDDKGTGSATFHGESFIGGKKWKTTNCNGSGKSELHEVMVNEEDNTYSIHAIGPGCSGETIDHIGGQTSPFGPEFSDLSISNQQLVNKDLLAGSKTTTSDVVGMGTVTTTVSWSLQRSATPDVELIVTPEDYDNWLPEPGRNERTAGTIMKVSLKLQGRNGAPTTKKAKSFELRLSNTSTEPGMTINFPVNSTNKSPDLKFMPQTNAVIPDTTFQTMKIICSPASQTGEFKIGSFDGGGWTVLNAEAILDDNTRVPGRLLVSNGETDIHIPKRELNSKIAEAWLTANANPGEMDDKEKTAGNTNDGDGLTAYEEYRGVISEGKFKRLDPNKKEVGVLATQTDFALFKEGMNWFNKASELEIVRFDFAKDEIAGDGRLNMNKKSAHDFDQYAIYIFNGGLAPGSLGVAYCRKATEPWIPANIIGVVINWNYIQVAYQRRVAGAMPDLLKFTLKDYLAQTVAHELGHAVNVDHHGNENRYDSVVIKNNSASYRIFNHNQVPITERPYTLYTVGFSSGTVESGDMACMLNYYPYFHWGYTVGADGAHIFNKVPFLPLGKLFCTSKIAKGINATQLYFGDGAKGNCLGQIQLRK